MADVVSMDLSSDVTVSMGGTRQLLKPVKPRGVDPAIQSDGSPTIRCEKAQETTQAAMSCCRLARLRRLPVWLTYVSTSLGWTEPRVIFFVLSDLESTGCVSMRETVEAANPRTSRK